MPFQIKTLATLALLTTTATLTNAAVGKTTRYWDCCKPSCAWEGKGQASGVVGTCDINDKPLSDPNAKSGCEGGPAYMCSSQSPWAVSADLAYGFGAVSSSNVKCCACYQLTFTNTKIAGKKMIIQATNTGGDVADAQFDLAIPGGGFGIFDGCTTEWDATSDVWGAQYGGMSPNDNKCAQMPSPLQPGCNFRYDWMQGADNPEVDWEEVACPAALVAKTGCGVASGSSEAKRETETETPTESEDTASPVTTIDATSSSAAPTTPENEDQGESQGEDQGARQGGGQGGGQGAGQGADQGADQGAGQGTFDQYDESSNSTTSTPPTGQQQQQEGQDGQQAGGKDDDECDR